MKKILLFAVACFIFCACTNKAEKVVEQADTTVVDSTVVDSTVVDSVK